MVRTACGALLTQGEAALLALQMAWIEAATLEKSRKKRLILCAALLAERAEAIENIHNRGWPEANRIALERYRAMVGRILPRLAA